MVTRKPSSAVQPTLPPWDGSVPEPVRSMWERGYSVVPQRYNDGGKIPLYPYKEWQQERPPWEVVEHWALANPDCLWAIVVPQDECRLDFDVQHGATEVGWVGLNPTVWTPHGGVHVSVKVPFRVKSSQQGKISAFKGLEILGHPHLATFYGDGYEEGMGETYDLADLPSQLQQEIEQRMWTEEDRKEATLPDDFSDFTPLSVILREMVDKVNADETRNEVGFWGFCQARDERFDIDEVRQFALEQYLPKVTDAGNHPYTEGEAFESVMSAFSRPPREPRGLQGGGELERLKAKLRLNREAYKAVLEEEASALFIPPAYRKSLREELAIQEEPLSYLVNSLFVEGHNVRLVGKNKSGKTTLVENLWRSLLDGSPFLSAFPVDRPLGKVAYWNGELSERQFRSWCREMNIVNQDQGIPLNTRGRLMDLSLAVVQQWTIDWLKSNDVEVWIIDPFTSFYFGEENSNTEVKKWTLGLDMVKDQAGVKEVILVTHEGRAISTEGEEHTRGASAIEGWADVLWTIAKDGEDRFFGAFGRDVDLPQQKLGYRSSDRALSLAGGGRADAKEERLVLKILSILVEQNDKGNGPGYGELESYVKGKGIDTNAIHPTVKRLEPTLVTVEKVVNKNEHWITELGRERLRLTDEGEVGFVLR